MRLLEVGEEYEDHLAEIAKKKAEEITETRQKHEEEQDGVGQKEDADGQGGNMAQACNGHDLNWQISNLVVGVQELVVVIKVLIFVSICGLVLNSYDVLKGWAIYGMNCYESYLHEMLSYKMLFLSVR